MLVITIILPTTKCVQHVLQYVCIVTRYDTEPSLNLFQSVNIKLLVNSEFQTIFIFADLFEPPQVNSTSEKVMIKEKH